MDKSTFEGILTSLRDEPEKWTEGDYILDHESGLSLWISCGVLSWSVYRPVKRSFTIFQKIILKVAVNRWREWNVRSKLDISDTVREAKEILKNKD